MEYLLNLFLFLLIEIFFLKCCMFKMMVMFFVADNDVWKRRRNIHRDRIHLHPSYQHHHHPVHSVWQLHHDNKGDDDDDEEEEEEEETGGAFKSIFLFW